MNLCAQGCSQIPGLGYGDTYSLTGAMATLRLILSLGDTNDWKIHNMDAKTAFSNSTLTEDIYLRPPVWNYLHQNVIACTNLFMG